LLKKKIKRKDEIRELVTKAIDSEAVEDYSKAEEEDVKENSPQSSDDEENISEDENEVDRKALTVPIKEELV